MLGEQNTALCKSSSLENWLKNKRPEKPTVRELKEEMKRTVFFTDSWS